MTDLYSSGPTYGLNMEHLRWGRFSTRPSSQTEPDHAEVYYVQSSVSLGDPEQALLIKELAPVRETVEPELLGFENLIQRDLDDARVTNALIPYLLSGGHGVARMFPSILVVLLPTKHERIGECYLPRHTLPAEPQGSLERVVERYGDGDRQWAFEFSRMRARGGSFVPYGAHLRVNPHLCKFAIIDGQHRAMALLALYRNLNTWPDRGRAFKEFYANHPRERLTALDLEGLSLPVTICFFPNMHAANPGMAAQNLSVVKASRKLFLDVNRTAKIPSKARQVLLDDERITSEFVRAIMTHFKDKSTGAPGTRLCNLYYDQMEDYESALPRMAVTSVLHLQYMVRMLLLGARPHTGERLVTRADFGNYNPSVQDNNRTLVELLAFEEHFGIDAGSWKDETIPANSRKAVVELFTKRWGQVMIHFLDEFPVFRAIAASSAETRSRLDQSTNEEDPLVKRMLFEGQGLRAVHEHIMEELRSREDVQFPYPEPTRVVFKRQADRLQEVEADFLRRAAEIYWIGRERTWPSWLSPEDCDRLIALFRETLCSRLFRTKAFQVGVIMALAHIERKLPEESREVFWQTGVPRMLLSLLSAYFQPSAPPGNTAGAERTGAWVAECLTDGRIGSFAKGGIYEYVRQVLRGDLKDARWQLAKYCVLECLYAPRIRELKAIRTQWEEEASRDHPSYTRQLHSLLIEVDQILIDAIWHYRDALLAKELDGRRHDHRAQTGHEATDQDVEQFWKDVRSNLARRLSVSFDRSEGELNEVRNRARPVGGDGPPDEDDDDERESGSGPESSEGAL